MMDGRSPAIRVQVECRKGPALLPRRFGVRGDEREVAEILDVWPGEDHRYLKVRTDEGDVYILRHDTKRDAWEIVVYEMVRAEDRSVR